MISIHAVLFDYGLVLTGPPDPAARVKMQQVLNVDEASLQTAYWRHRDAYDRGALSGVAYWRQVGADLDRMLDAASLAALIEADNALWTQPNEPMIDWAASLQRAGVKTGILSNIGDEMEAGIRSRFPWLAEFSHHTFSHRLGIAKPDLEIYRIAADGMGETPGHILFVDDKPENIQGARDAGMVAVQYSTDVAFGEQMSGLGLSSLWRSDVR